MTFTRESIESRLSDLIASGEISKMAAGLFRNHILGEMKTITELRSTTRDQFVRAHDRVGHQALSVWDKIVEWMYESEKAEQARNNAEQDAIISENRRRQEAERREAEVNPRFTYDQLKTLVATMELCGFAEIDLRRINDFFGAVKAKDWANQPARSES